MCENRMNFIKKAIYGGNGNTNLRLLSFWVKSLISRLESLSEDKVPGISFKINLDSKSMEVINLLMACIIIRLTKPG